MRLLRVITSVNPKNGGPIAGISQQAGPLARLGVEVDILCADSPRSDWVSTNTLPNVHAVGPGIGGYVYCKQLQNWLFESADRYDAVIVHGLWQHHGYAVRKALKTVGVPYFVFVHGMLDPWFKSAYPVKHVKKWLYWLAVEYRVLRDARAVLFTCEEEKRLARQSFALYQCNERVVSYGTSGPNGAKDELTGIFYGRYPELQGKRILLFLGRIHPKKGCDLLIQAFSQCAPQYPDLQLVIAGPDQVGWSSQLKHLTQQNNIEHRVSWTGMLSGDLKWGAIYSADAFVLPSHQENFGISVAEALACGVPVLISDKVNIWREIIEDGAGIVGVDSAEGCEAVLKSWMESSEADQYAMRKAARACFLRRFESEQAAADLVATISALL